MSKSNASNVVVTEDPKTHVITVKGVMTVPPQMKAFVESRTTQRRKRKTRRPEPRAIRQRPSEERESKRQDRLDHLPPFTPSIRKSHSVWSIRSVGNILSSAMKRWWMSSVPSTNSASERFSHARVTMTESTAPLIWSRSTRTNGTSEKSSGSWRTIGRTVSSP